MEEGRRPLIFESDTDDELAAGRAILVLLRRLIVRSQTLTDDLVRPHGITGPQFLTLLLIGNHTGLTQTELVRLMESDANSVSAMVRRLAERGLVVRSPHPNDRRAMQLRLTDEGDRLARAGLKEMNRLSRHLARTLPGKHARAITDWMTALIMLREVPAEL